MKKTIRDLFTQEEWDILAEDLVPGLVKIAEFPLNCEEDAEDEAE